MTAAHDSLVDDVIEAVTLAASDLIGQDDLVIDDTTGAVHWWIAVRNGNLRLYVGDDHHGRVSSCGYSDVREWVESVVTDVL